MTGDFCLCIHALEAHDPDDGPCRECNCDHFELDPFLEAGPDGKPVTTFLRPVEEYPPLELLP